MFAIVAPCVKPGRQHLWQCTWLDGNNPIGDTLGDYRALVNDLVRRDQVNLYAVTAMAAPLRAPIPWQPEKRNDEFANY